MSWKPAEGKEKIRGDEGGIDKWDEKKKLINGIDDDDENF